MIGTRIVEEVLSKFNGKIRVARTLGLGTYIQADGLTQSGGIVNSIWKPTLKKIKSQNPEITHCLVLGLGGGTVVEILKKLWPDIQITGVDIDPLIVDLGIKHLKLNEDQVNIKILDADQYVKESGNKFDLIIVDLYNGRNYPTKFESDGFLKALQKKISKNGMVVFNRVTFLGKKANAIQFGEDLKKYFRQVETFYPVTNVMFICQKSL